ncbi:DUF397 domain-containing protein [Kineosporia babensis]|uniref:DUF397 domain-containing protein n=1 Tax=Kineosporia babensis TaxID=499548 RepID=A0A9X1NM19_9ACTN|nr:DUF397 domain-containing protein [Kineosporia babensis]MCD5316830.1 DUF397 domain-containing protein [Kineosporia babensis]
MPTLEVFHEPAGATLVRHGKDPKGPRLRFSFSEWCDFVAATKERKLEDDCAVMIRQYPGGVVLMSNRQTAEGPVLICSRQEWGQFIMGVDEGAYDRDGYEPVDGCHDASYCSSTDSLTSV